MMKIGIALDGYKLPLFEQELTGYGYEYTVGNGITPNTILITVEVGTADVPQLAKHVKIINTRAQKEKDDGILKQSRDIL